MKKETITILMLFTLLLAACAPAVAAQVEEEPTLVPTEPQPTATEEPTATATPDYPPEGVGPVSFPTGVNPLTGLEVADPDQLNERVAAVKVENLPREHRPQYGLNDADLVYEYYTEFGSTRFVALYHGNAPETVGPVRSARFFDIHVVQSYKAAFLFGGAYSAVFNRMWGSDISRRLVVEGAGSYPALFRANVNDANLLFANISALPDALTKLGIDNQAQDLSGMLFKKQLDVAGFPADEVTVHFSNAIYNRWAFDETSQKYLRYVDEYNVNKVEDERYVLLTDQVTGQAISADNVVILFVPHSYFVKNATEEVVDINLVGSGEALIARDGQIFTVYWQRATTSSTLTLVDGEGNPFPFKPGNTWFEVVGSSATKVQQDDSWRITHRMP